MTIEYIERRQLDSWRQLCTTRTIEPDYVWTPDGTHLLYCKFGRYNIKTISYDDIKSIDGKPFNGYTELL